MISALVVPERSTSTLADFLVPYLRDRGSRSRVVVFGNYGQGNLGDEAILVGILDDLRHWCRPVVISRSPGRVTRMHGVRAEGLTTRAGLMAVLRADVVAIGGGGIFGNGMTLMPRLLPFVALVSRLLGKRVVFMAIGAYETAPRSVIAPLRWCARVSDLVTVRDEESARVMRHKTQLVPDPAIAMVPATPDAARIALEAAGLPAGQGFLGLSLKPTMSADSDEHQQLLAAATVEHWLTTTEDDVVMFCLSERGNFGLGVSVTDETLSREVADRSSAPERVHVVGPDLDPRVMKAAFGLARITLAHRLHAQIFSSSMQVPTAGLSYERKSDAFLDAAGLPRFDPRDADADEILSWLAATAPTTSSR